MRRTRSDQGERAKQDVTVILNVNMQQIMLIIKTIKIAFVGARRGEVFSPLGGPFFLTFSRRNIYLKLIFYVNLLGKE